MKYLAVVTTTSSRTEAQALAHAMVERRLAACAQISEIESFYRWEGAVQNDLEYRVLFKTTQARYAELEAAIREMHSYELPAIHALMLDPMYGPYADWIEDNTCGTSGG